VEAIEDILGLKIGRRRRLHVETLSAWKATDLTAQQVDMIAGELLANDIIQQWKIFMP
jgi:phosphoribosylformylglycinamidine (FGAM) synthase PurS component